MSETLKQAVEAQARARVAGDLTAFASFCTPQALAMAHSSKASKPRSCEVLAVVANDATGSSDVLYRGSDAHVLAQRWQIIDGIWTAVDIQRLRAPRQSPWKRFSSWFERPPSGGKADDAV